MVFQLPQFVTAATVVAAAVLLAGCGPSDESDRLTNPGPLSGPFYVSDHFAPSGHMGDGEVAGYITALVGEEALEARRTWCAGALSSGAPVTDGCPERPPGAGGDPYVFIWDPGPQMWMGVYWVYPANNWGRVPGRALDPNYRYTKARFWAATDTPGTFWEFFIGGIKNPTFPYQDKISLPHKVSALSHDYTQFEITIPPQIYEVEGRQIDTLLGGFGIATNLPASTPAAEVPGKPPRAIFLDDIVWE
ncbi:MAG TPA: hypothetical protein VM686_41075 [Polyangiaceae bacterium]|nr:hypothetical protein [Polyangiaceae bacterium]